MSEMLKSTVAFKSNLQPVHTEKIINDKEFLSTVHDPFGLELMRKKNLRLTRNQALEYKRVSMHCVYADKGDYPFGTIIDEFGSRRVVCKCHKRSCKNFSQCRPDFNPEELDVYQDNMGFKDKIESARLSFEMEDNLTKSYDRDDEAAAHLYDNSVEDIWEEIVDYQKSDEDVLNAQHTYISPSQPEADIFSDELEDATFESFSVTEQENIIRSKPTKRIIVNAGPGTGKTWTLVEKVKYMLAEDDVDPENILILCFSRAAVDVIRTRLKIAADSGGIPLIWHLVDIRTFDSFATYMIAWVIKNMPELLPQDYSLESQNYDERIATAVSILKSEKDLLSEYQHIIIDEVQDLVGDRAELVLALLESLPGTCGFTLFGDSCQALYDYLTDANQNIMSSSEFYNNLFHEFRDADFYTLDKNFRQDDEFSSLTKPYREAILIGNAADRAREAAALYSNVASSHINLVHFTSKESEEYRSHGTLGILTRTNGQALQISTWLRNEGVEHQLKKKSESQNLASWIYNIILHAETDVIGKEEFLNIFHNLYPQSPHPGEMFWNALANTQRNATDNYYEIERLLRGLSQNSRDPLLFQEPRIKDFSAITVSTIHKAKGCEFDSVLVLEDVISQMSQVKQDDELEHKVCYVAATRPKKKLEKVPLKEQFIYIMKDESRRCFMRGGRSRKIYLSHFEVGITGDLDERSFALNKEIQNSIQKLAGPGMRLKLLKCPETTKEKYFVYRIVLEDNEKVILGYTSKRFYQCMQSAIQRVFDNNRPIDYKYFPGIFDDIYVDGLTTCISSDGSNIDGAKQFGSMYIWKGISISGFAHMIKDRY